MQRILLIEDSVQTQMIVKQVLGNQFEVTCAGSVSEAVEKVRGPVFDLVIIDVVLPDGDGFHLCTKLRTEHKLEDIPIIFLTGKSDTSDKVMAFSLGADDYVVKPFEPQEFRARVRAKLEKAHKKLQVPTKIQKGDLRFDLSFQRVVASHAGNEADLKLTPVEFKILYYLATNEGQLVSSEQLLNTVWQGTTHVGAQNIYTHVSSLRRKLGVHAHYLESIPRMGYRFVVAEPLKQAV